MEQKFYLNSDKTNNQSISLKSWIDSFRDEEEMKEIFLNMDRALKYIHDHGYCIQTFDPNCIEILNDSLNQIRFSELMKMPDDSMQQKKIIKEDIYNSSFIQIGLYTNCLSYLKKDFLKSNFDGFATFLPEKDVPYYRGVIERGASVYLCEYVAERTKRDLASLEKELAGDDVKPISTTAQYSPTGVNDEINDAIYRHINTKRSDAAFVTTLIFPTLVLSLAMILALIIWLFV